MQSVLAGLLRGQATEVRARARSDCVFLYTSVLDIVGVAVLARDRFVLIDSCAQLQHLRSA